MMYCSFHTKESCSEPGFPDLTTANSPVDTMKTEQPDEKPYLPKKKKKILMKMLNYILIYTYRHICMVRASYY